MGARFGLAHHLFQAATGHGSGAGRNIAGTACPVAVLTYAA